MVRIHGSFCHCILTGLGDPVGLACEEDFKKKAIAAGFTEDEAKDAFNNNMMATGLLSELPLDFAREHQRSWLVAEYEAGDVVLHTPHTVWNFSFWLRLYANFTDPCVYNQQ